MNCLEDLLDAADKLASENESPPRPNFPIPTDLATLAERTPQLLEHKETPGKGMGWFARQNIPSGTILMVAKPLAMVMLWEEDDAADDEDEKMEEDEENDGENDDTSESLLNSMLVLELLKELKKSPERWNNDLSLLYPRNQTDLENLPVRQCNNETISQHMESLLKEIQEMPDLKHASNDIAQRLPLIVRYNVLSVETSSELLSHPGPGGHANLGGAGLYHLPSFFNHNPRPNVTRWAIGDVMCFVTNQDISAGTEACISYIEHDVLCESVYRRNIMLQMDFDDVRVTGENGDNETYAEEEDGPAEPVVDTELQNELMETNAFERLDSIDQLLQQAHGMASPEEPGDSMEDAAEPGWFQCDIQNLNILKAITLDGLGQSSQALKVWEECVAFAESKLPPLDESSVVVRVQAALCSLHSDDKNSIERAREHANKALYIHDKLFGGGSSRLRRRYKRDFELCLRKNKMKGDSQAESNPIDYLWPLA